jgi:hypothetical protein
MVSNFLGRLLRLYTEPKLFVRYCLLKSPYVPFTTRLRWDAIEYPFYAYGMYHAAIQAKSLDIREISAIEFGVASGNGLVQMEKIANEITTETGIQFQIYGFDTGKGNPEPRDYRDVPFIWRHGQFRMDEVKLRGRLRSATLIIGNVSETLANFLTRYNPKPIGFISFDMDYYSSTKQAFSLLNGSNENFLPRMFCYFDDVVGDDSEFHCDFFGELLAIKEFNAENENKKFALINGLSYKRHLPRGWHVKMHILHRFDHPKYCTFVNPKGDWQLPLK